MSRSTSNEWPPALRERLAGERLEEGIGLTIQLLTADEDGWPAVALLSVGEVVAPDARTARLALWPGTTATANLTRSSRGTLAIIGDGDAWYVRIQTRRRDNLFAGGMDHAFFEAMIERVLHDEVSYARLTSGVTFELPDPESVLARWRATVDALLQAPASVDEPASAP